MEKLGELIHHESDAEGPLSVYQCRDRRFLTFGNRVELGKFPKWNKAAFFAEAEALAIQLGIPLQKLARNLWRQNAEPLKIGRFRWHP
jgi:hypothetical protein